MTGMRSGLVILTALLLSGSAAMAQSNVISVTDARGGANGPALQVGGDPNVADNVKGSTSSSSMLMYRLKQESAGGTARTTTTTTTTTTR